MNIVLKIFSNDIINIAVLGWVIAQAAKVILVLVKQKKLDFTRFTGSGGMPSSHSSTVAGLTTYILKTEGYSSPLFALALVFSIVVMYDAAGVRRAAGEQAKILNRIMKDWNKTNPKKLQKELKELLGHTKTEVFVGMILGIAIALLYNYIFQ